jgi:RNA polymerase sigma-70 factor (ECF subfamily)
LPPATESKPIVAVDRREIERLLPALRRYARGLTGNVSFADDLVQDTVVKALTKEKQFSGDNLSGWLFAILTNTARSQARRARRGPFVIALDEPADGGTDPAARVGIIRALEALGAEHREVLLLTAVEGFSYREAADILEVPIGTIMSRLARARDQLAERLQGAPVVPIRRIK